MKREARGAASVPVRLWVYKCNALNLPHQVAWGDWDEVFTGKRPTEWGGSQTMRSTASLHILWEEMTRGDVILAYQTDLQAAVGLCELTDLIDYVDQDGEPQREMWLRPIERFPQPVKIHQLKGADPVLAGARALRRGWPQTLYATTPQEAGALLAACGAKYRLPARPSSSVRRGSTRGGGFGDPRANKRVESAAIAFVRATYEREGWTVTSVEREKLGYDLLVTKASREEHLEVKGTRAAEASFIITAGEVRRVRTDPAMRLCLVADALSRSPTLQSWRAGEVERDFVLSPVSYWAKRRRDDDR